MPTARIRRRSPVYIFPARSSVLSLLVRTASIIGAHQSTCAPSQTATMSRSDALPPVPESVALAACGGLEVSARAYAATNPTTAAAPTAYHGYCCVHQRTSAASLSVACISATVRCIAVLASAACCARNTALIRGVVALRLLWHGQRRCVRRRRVAGAGVRHTVAPSAGVTCVARSRTPMKILRASRINVPPPTTICPSHNAHQRAPRVQQQLHSAVGQSR